MRPALFASLWLAVATVATYVPSDAPKTDNPFALPTTPPAPPPVPPPPPAPGAVPKLVPHVWYVVNSKVDASAKAYPAGLVKVVKETGPVKIHGVFVDGNGTAETRTYPGPHVFIVTAAGTGRVDLVLTPFGLKAESEIVTTPIDVYTQAPKPPPVDPVDPPVPPPVEVKTFRVLFVVETTKTLTPQQNGVIHGAETAKYLDANTTPDGTTKGWRKLDKDKPTTGDTVTMNELWAAVKPNVTAVPCVAIEVNGKVDIVPLPATVADAIALFNKYLGK